MGYIAPYVDAAGLHLNLYADLLSDLQGKTKNIYGQSIYIENDAADEQLLAIFAQKIFDYQQALQLDYNNRAPATAIGSALDSLIKLNGIARKVASFSTCLVILAGTPATVINHGVVQDITGNLWNLPASVTLGDGLAAASIHTGGNGYVVGDTITPTQFGSSGGTLLVTAVGGGGAVTGLAPLTTGGGFSIASNLPSTTSGSGIGCRVNITALGSTVSATAQVIGSIVALPGTITSISTPAAGWLSVYNAVAATVGQPVETDSQLRARQAISTSLPALTPVAGTVAAIASLAGVGRYVVYENPTGSVSTGTVPEGIPAGLPPHSITCVVEGSTEDAIAQSIYDNRTLGCFTNGTTTVLVTDPANGGLITPISFYEPTYQPIFVQMTVKRLAGYTTATTAAIKNAIAAYLNSLQLGEIVTCAGVAAAAMGATSSTAPQFSVQLATVEIGLTGGSLATSDITLNFYQVAQGNTADITVNTI